MTIFVQENNKLSPVTNKRLRNCEIFVTSIGDFVTVSTILCSTLEKVRTSLRKIEFKFFEREKNARLFQF